MTYFKNFFSGNVDTLFDYKNIENDGVDYDERSTINSSLDSGTLSSKSSGKQKLELNSSDSFTNSVTTNLRIFSTKINVVIYINRT